MTRNSFMNMILRYDEMRSGRYVIFVCRHDPGTDRTVCRRLEFEGPVLSRLVNANQQTESRANLPSSCNTCSQYL